MKFEYCQCGCGRKTKPGNRFIYGHNRRGVIPTQESINRWKASRQRRKKERKSIGQFCECGCSQWTNPERRFIRGHWRRGRTKETEPSIAAQAEKLFGRTKETHPYIIEQAKKRIGNNFALGYHHTKEVLRIIAEKSKSRKRNYRYKLSEEHKRKIGKSLKGRKSPLIGRIVLIETRSKISKATEGCKNPNWKGGISAEPYCEVWNDRGYKESIKERDNYQCQNPTCQKENEIDLMVHHINYKKKDCTPSNLITLCRSCNSRANFNRENWEKLYIFIMREKLKEAA